jgi:preprotein translocase subunit YajC
VIIGASSGSGVLFIIVIAFLLLWLIVVRPQRRRQSQQQQQQQQMLSDLTVGDEVLTAGGIYGTISQLDEDQVTVEIAPNTEVRVDRRAIASVTREEEPAESEEPEADAEESSGQEGDPTGPIPDGESSDEENRG